MAHHPYGASQIDRVVACPGSTALIAALPERPDTGSFYAAEGTAMHALAEAVLKGRTSSCAIMLGEPWQHDGYSGTYTVELVEAVEQYVDRTRAIFEEHGGSLFVEQSLDIGALVGEPGSPDARSTADAVVLSQDGRTVVVRDLKGGAGKRVDANETLQTVMYGAAVVEQFGPSLDIEHPDFRVIVEIDQPRWRGDDPVTRRVLTLPELRAEEQRIRDAVAKSRLAAASPAIGNTFWSGHFLRPTEKGCQWCAAKATCPALGAHVERTVAMSFDDLGDAGNSEAVEREAASEDNLAARYAALPLIELFCDAVREAARERAERGALPGYKLVAGRRGARAWSDADKAEETLRGFRLPVDDIYTKKLISPTQAEKLLAKDSPKRWEKLAALVTQPDGKPEIVLDSDKRPAIRVAADAFDDNADLC